MTTRQYTREFSGGGQRWRCTFMITLTGIEMDWAPSHPPQSAPFWRTYSRWRDRCLHDFSERTGVVHRVITDVPWIGLRLRVECLKTEADNGLRRFVEYLPAEREKAYAWAKAHYDEARALIGGSAAAAAAVAELQDRYSIMMLAMAPEPEPEPEPEHDSAGLAH